MNYFLDSSAIVKRYVHEDGSAWMHNRIFTGKNHLFISQIAPTEVMSAIYRQYRSGIYQERDADAIRLWLNRHVRREYHQVLLSSEIIALSQSLLKQYALRAYDSLQLASALFVYHSIQKSGTKLIFLTSDIRLVQFAQSEKLPVINPQNP